MGEAVRHIKNKLLNATFINTTKQIKEIKFFNLQFLIEYAKKNNIDLKQIKKLETIEKKLIDRESKETKIEKSVRKKQEQNEQKKFKKQLQRIRTKNKELKN